MAVNRTPGQSASGFRLYVDKAEHSIAKLEEVTEGVKFLYKGMEYTVTEMLDNMQVKLEGTDGFKSRSIFVDLTQLCKSGSEYIFKRDV